VTTQPFGAIVQMFPVNDYVIIGSNMNPYSAHSLDRPAIKNISGDENTDIGFDEICVYREVGSSLVGTSEQCDPIPGGIIYHGETVFFETIPSYS
jgi:hypothetical protein